MQHTPIEFFSRNRTKLCGELIKDHFGDIVANVGNCFIHFGNLTLESLIHFSKLPYDSVKKALIVLIQHNLVTFMKERVLIKHYEEREPIPKRRSAVVIPEKKSITGDDKTVYYILHIDRVINLLSAGKEIQKVKNQMGVMCALIFETILDHGRLSYKMILDKVKNSFLSSTGEEIEADSEDEEKAKNEVRKCFDDLVRHYAVKIVPKEISVSVRTKGSPDQSTTPTKDEEEEEDVISPSGLSVPKLTLPKLGKGRRGKKNGEKVGKKRKRVEFEDSDEEKDSRKRQKIREIEPTNFGSYNDDTDLWTVNHTSFLISERMIHIVEYVNAVCEPECAQIIGEMITMSGPYNTVDEPASRPVSLFTIKKRMKEKYNLRSSNFMRYFFQLTKKEYVRGLQDDPIRNVPSPKSPMSDEEEEEEEEEETSTFLNDENYYFVDFIKVLDECKILHVRRILERKFGITAPRIFSVLLKGQKLEEENICDKIMISIERVRTILFKLLQYGYVEMHDIPRTHDHDPKRAIHLWSVNTFGIYRCLINEMYKTLRNLRFRGFHEEDTAVLPFVRFEVLEGLAEATEEEKVVLQKSYQAGDRIEGSMVRLLKLINLFESF